MSDGAGERRAMTVFYASCWVLGMVAFVELVSVGIAMALPKQSTKGGVRIVKVPAYVPVDVANKVEKTRGEDEASQDVLRDFEKLRQELEGLKVEKRGERIESEQKDLGLGVDDPIVERLLTEAREARIQGDMRVALVKLEEANSRLEGEVMVLYELGLVFEAMGIYDRALDYYHQVYEMGVEKAGELYVLVGKKLSEGFHERNDLMALGQVREFRDFRVLEGERVVLTIPVTAALGEEIDPNDVQVEVSCYDKVDGKVTPSDSLNELSSRWVSEPVDWRGVREELLQVTYVVPATRGTRGVDGRLFGERHYYGHVVELSYKGEVIDQQAWPRLLARERNVKARNPFLLLDDDLPSFNPENPLLPALDEEQ